jgi:hypothetical protein
MQFLQKKYPVITDENLLAEFIAAKIAIPYFMKDKAEQGLAQMDSLLIYSEYSVDLRQKALSKLITFYAAYKKPAEAQVFLDKVIALSPQSEVAQYLIEDKSLFLEEK